MPIISAAASGTITIGGDLTVNRLGFGAMRITGPGIWGEPKDPAEARRVLDRTVELGVNFIDTADSYGPEVSERLIGETLYPYAQGVVIATKGGLVREGPDQWAPLGYGKYLKQQVEMSLRRLKLERIDLYQLHRIDPRTSMEDSLGALGEMQNAGKIRHIGLFEASVIELRQARGIVPIVSVQNLYNLRDRQHDGVLNYCQENGLAFIARCPLAAGRLLRTGGPVEAAAKRYGITVAQMAIACLLGRSKWMLPIPGTSSVAHLEENVAAAGIELS